MDKGSVSLTLDDYLYKNVIKVILKQNIIMSIAGLIKLI